MYYSTLISNKNRSETLFFIGGQAVSEHERMKMCLNVPNETRNVLSIK